MSTQHRPLVAIFTAPEGHLSLAQAAQAALEPHYKVLVHFYEDPSYSLYRPFYQFFPGLFRLPFKLSKSESVVDAFYSYLQHRYQKKLSEFYETHRPAALISTSYLYNPWLDSVAQRDHVPFINIVSDPRTVHPILISPQADMNFAFDEQTAKLCRQFRPGSRCKASGWFVRPAFEQPYQKITVKKELHLNPDKQTLLVASGSEGTTHIMKLLPALISLSHPLQVVVACGTNTSLLRGMKMLKQLFKRVKSQTTIIPLTFTNELHKYMQAADLIIGKAGPNSLFEAVATRTPFFALTHISGQEDGNLELIREHHLGFVEENPLKAQHLLKEILDHPQQLTELMPHLEKMARYNEGAKPMLVAELKKLLAHHT